MASTPGKCIYMLKIWLEDASVKSVKLSKNLKFKKKLNKNKILKNGVQMSKHERIFHFKPCVYLAYFKSYGHLKILKCIETY